MKLTYWLAKCLDDDTAFSIRSRTKKECKERREQRPERFGPVEKVDVEYKDGFDLVEKALGEGGVEP